MAKKFLHIQVMMEVDEAEILLNWLADNNNLLYYKEYE